MTERYSPQNPREVRRQNASQYENIWSGFAQARRALYAYEVPPGEDREPYNIWVDIADHLQPETKELIYEFGANDGYFHSILRSRGFRGKYVGVDIEGKDLPAVEHIARHRFPGTDVEFIQADAQNLKGVVDSNSVPAVAVNFINYHAEKPGRILSELHRILTDDGVGVVSSRSTTNQLDTWNIARWVAHSNGFAFAQELTSDGKFKPGVDLNRISVYSHFDINQTRRSLKDSKKFEIVHEHVQDTDLWVPTDSDAALHDLESVVESLLPYTVSMKDLRKPNSDDMQRMYEFIINHMRHFFIVSGLKYQQENNLARPYYKSHATQGFFVVKPIK